ncbi:MAG TPA: isoprenylcysteine carboxylmethyltransferase family protein [Anaerolineales bacterium]|nr:isoprenylcysteine carboxylmethyltransferase family protein [Anaerolineales bacterium]
MESFLKFFLPVYLVLYFAIALFWRSFMVWKTTRVVPYVFGKTDTVHDFVGLLFRLTLLSCAVVIGVVSFWTDGYPYLAPIHWLENASLDYSGLGLLFLSFFWTFSAQAQMGNSWRIGIDTAHKTELVQSGIFKFSRNPVFLGMRLTLLGLFFILPNAPTFVIFLIGDLLMQIQVRLEEEFLTKTHGAAYREYCTQTRRWI